MSTWAITLRQLQLTSTCVDSLIPMKRVKMFANSKPWITSDFKKLLVEKKRAFKVNNRKLIQREIQEKINHSKGIYKSNVEQLLMNNNSQMAWRGIKSMIGQSNQPKIPGYTVEEANALNKHFARWESGGRVLPSGLENGMECTSISVSSREVERVFSSVKPHQAAGPDKLRSMVLRMCHEQLNHVFSDMF